MFLAIRERTPPMREDSETMQLQHTKIVSLAILLFNLVQPTNTYFGQKDFQQCVVIKQMVKDLNLPININVVSTVRDKDGLALSSRNIFLNSQERLQALSLYQSLLLGKKLILTGNKNVKTIKNKIIIFLILQNKTNLFITLSIFFITHESFVCMQVQPI